MLKKGSKERNKELDFVFCASQYSVNGMEANQVVLSEVRM